MISSIRKLLSTTRQVAESWFAIDRIRVTPSSGRLLSLQTGDTFMLFNNLYSVTERTVTERGSSHEVRCRLTYPAGFGELLIMHCSQPGHTTNAKFVADGREVDVFDDDVFIVKPE